MAIQMADNLNIRGNKPNVERDSFTTLAAMRSCNLAYYPAVFTAVCIETGKMYILNKSNDDDPITGKWRELKGGGGGADSGTYTGTSAVAVGGISKGQSFSDADIQTMFKALLEPYTKPTVTLTLTPSTTLYEKGKSVNGIKMTVGVTKGTKAVTKVEFYQGTTLINTVTSGVASGGTFTYTTTTAFTTETVLKAVAYDEGNSSAASATIKFSDASYVGIVDTNAVTADIVTGLTKTLVGVKGYAYKGITMSNKRVCYAYPSSFGALASAKDGNGFNVLPGMARKDLTVNGVSYFAYVMTDTGSLNNGSITFA